MRVLGRGTNMYACPFRFCISNCLHVSLSFWTHPACLCLDVKGVEKIAFYVFLYCTCTFFVWLWVCVCVYLCVCAWRAHPVYPHTEHWLFLWSLHSISWQQMQNLRDQREYHPANSTSDQREIFKLSARFWSKRCFATAFHLFSAPVP